MIGNRGMGRETREGPQERGQAEPGAALGLEEGVSGRMPGGCMGTLEIDMRAGWRREAS